MPLTRQQKEAKVAESTEALSGAASAVFMSYDGLSLADVNDLRNQLFEAGVNMRVVPKRLLKLATEAAKVEFDPTQHEGQFAIVWGDDVVAPAQVLAKFAKDNEAITLVAGVMESETIDADQVKALAALPSKEQLLGQLVSVLAGPMRGFAGTLAAVPRDFVGVLSAVQEEKAKA